MLAGLKHELMAPELVREFVRAFQEEANRAATERRQQLKSQRLQLDVVGRKIAAIVAAIEQGHYSRALGDRLAALERKQDALQSDLMETSAPVVHLHPRLADIYADKVARLKEALSDPAIRGQAADVLRTLITRIELRPNSQGDGIEALLHGDLAQILAYCNAAQDKSELPEDGSPGSQLSVVAGARSNSKHERVPVIFAA